MQPLISTRPFFSCMGNHEEESEFRYGEVLRLIVLLTEPQERVLAAHRAILLCWVDRQMLCSHYSCSMLYCTRLWLFLLVLSVVASHSAGALQVTTTWSPLTVSSMCSPRRHRASRSADTPTAPASPGRTIPITTPVGQHAAHRMHCGGGWPAKHAVTGPACFVSAS